MQLGMIGLGRMGGNIVRRLMKHGHTTVVYDKDEKAVAALGGRRRGRRQGAGGLRARSSKSPARGLGDAAGGQDHRGDDRGAGASLMEAGDIIIDGGNTFWQGRHPPRARR